MLDGAARLADLMAATKASGMSAIATTDHGYLFGAFDFWSQATAAGIKPIIGVEAYVTPGTDRRDKTRVKWRTDESQKSDDLSGGGLYTHMTLLSRNNTGMRNLFKASSYASLDSVTAKWPRLDQELLESYSEGLIATTGCPSGEIQVRLRLGQYEEAKAAAGKYREIFGKENYYVELMDHGLSIEKRVTKDLIRLSKELDIPLVATNDLHYTHESDAKAHGRCWPSNPVPNSSNPPTIRAVRGSPSPAPATTSRRPQRCGRCSRNSPKPATTPSRSPRSAKSPSIPRRTTCRSSRALPVRTRPRG